MKSVVVFTAFWFGACQTSSPQETKDPSNSEQASPNATLKPSPFATDSPPIVNSALASSSTRTLPPENTGRYLPDAGTASPEPLLSGVELQSESPSTKDVSGFTIQAAWRWAEIPLPPKSPEVSADYIREFQKKVPLSWRIHLTDTGRMRIEFTSRALPFPERSELLSRADRFGHLVLWPNHGGYRVLPTGSMRTALGERRSDVTSLFQVSSSVMGDGKRLNEKVTRYELRNSLSTLRIEMAKREEYGESGVLLCRLLLEIAGFDPKSSFCSSQELPLFAQIIWARGGAIAFEATSISKNANFPSNDFLMPPPGMKWMASGLPSTPDGIFLTKDELAAFRSGSAQLNVAHDPAAPAEGFIAVNSTDTLQYLLVDGVAVVAVPPASERYVIGPPKGRYTIQWRTFLGDYIGKPVVTEMPAKIINGMKQ